MGLGPGLRPCGGLLQLKELFDRHTFWARGRSPDQIRRLLAGSQAVRSIWLGQRLVGFGRASSDGVYRAVLWDVVVSDDWQGQGLGRQLVEALLDAPALQGVERTYLMTTNSAGFYEQLGFQRVSNQQLLLRSKNSGDTTPLRRGLPSPPPDRA